MARPVLTLPGAYSLTLEMGCANDANVNWRNTFDIWSPTSVPISTAPIITAIQGFLQANLRSDAFIATATLRNWSQGPQPFASRPFIWQVTLGSSVAPGTKQSAPPNGYGGEEVTTDVTPGTICALVKRYSGPATRSSHLFLRGLLDQLDYACVTGGKPFLIATSNVTQAKFNQIVGQFLANYIGGGAAAPYLCVVHVGNHYNGPPFQSQVYQLALEGVTQNKQTRKNAK